MAFGQSLPWMFPGGVAPLSTLQTYLAPKH
jgi:hypothetical protein